MGSFGEYGFFVVTHGRGNSDEATERRSDEATKRRRNAGKSDEAIPIASGQAARRRKGAIPIASGQAARRRGRAERWMVRGTAMMGVEWCRRAGA